MLTCQLALLTPLGTFSIAYGVIADVASPAERGSFVSAVSFAYVLVYEVVCLS